jgi:hypothetical protein
MKVCRKSNYISNYVLAICRAKFTSRAISPFRYHQIYQIVTADTRAVATIRCDISRRQKSRSPLNINNSPLGPSSPLSTVSPASPRSTRLLMENTDLATLILHPLSWWATPSLCLVLRSISTHSLSMGRSITNTSAVEMVSFDKASVHLLVTWKVKSYVINLFRVRQTNFFRN